MKILLVILLLLFPVHRANSIKIHKTAMYPSAVVVFWNLDENDVIQNEMFDVVYCQVFDNEGVKIGAQGEYLKNEDFGRLRIWVDKQLQTDDMKVSCRVGPAKY